MAKVRSMTMQVNLVDLEIMSRFNCEHPDAPCNEEDVACGACCNACWARRWASKMLLVNDDPDVTKIR